MSESLSHEERKPDLKEQLLPSQPTEQKQTQSHDNSSSIGAGAGAPVTIRKSHKANEEPSMTLILFAYWVIPVLILAAVSRYGVNTDMPSIPVPPNKSRPVTIDLKKNQPSPHSRPSSQGRATARASPSPQPAAAPSWPTAYRAVVETIEKRRRRIESQVIHVDGSTTKLSPTPPKGRSRDHVTQSSTDRRQHDSRGPSSDPVRQKLIEKIAELRREYENKPDDIHRAISYADAMRFYDIQYHDGGVYEAEAIRLYQNIVTMAVEKREKLIATNRPTNVSLSLTTNVNDEAMLDYSAKSADGLLCAIYSAQGKVYFMANMFERAVEAYDRCLDLYPGYLDAVNARGSALIILGRYQEAGRDLLQVIQEDKNRHFVDAFTGFSRVLEAKPELFPDGWDNLISVTAPLIAKYENHLQSHRDANNALASTLNRLHHVMFTYNDIETKEYDVAFRHLTESYKHKLSILPPWPVGHEKKKISATMSIFTSGFWSMQTGSQTHTPIFIIGFVRSGSTLLERVLDAHPMIVGTGENSVFNGRLDYIRNRIVDISAQGQLELLPTLTRDLAEDVVAGMKSRWEMLVANTDKTADQNSSEHVDPKRFVDKMLTNYHNVGFIQMLYPNALILHVAREPMDTLFSAYKHEFPPGTLDYTSDFTGLAELYHCYRDMMDHWDRVLPGRITHVRYEDLVNDMPGMARAIIRSTGLQWNESVLEFHTKKHAVNTLSTTQVRKGIYKDSLNYWRRYEKQLNPLVELIGSRFDYDLKTTLPDYLPPSSNQ